MLGPLTSFWKFSLESKRETKRREIFVDFFSFYDACGRRRSVSTVRLGVDWSTSTVASRRLLGCGDAWRYEHITTPFYWLFVLMGKEIGGWSVRYRFRLIGSNRFTSFWPIPRYDYCYFVSLESPQLVGCLSLFLAGLVVSPVASPTHYKTYRTFMLHFLNFLLSMSNLCPYSWFSSCCRTCTLASFTLP